MAAMPSPLSSLRHKLARLIAGPAPAQTLRPVVIGMGPCGLFAGLVLAQLRAHMALPDYADAPHLGLAQGAEHHNLVHAVQQLGAEEGLQGVVDRAGDERRARMQQQHAHLLHHQQLHQQPQ
jgi:uncharacterized FAD-dependent dehydrogenase